MRVIHAASCLVLMVLLPTAARAQDPESLLGTVEVDGSAGTTTSALPKVAVVPLLSIRTTDAVAQQIVRDDLSISGEVDVLGDAVLPRGPHLPGTALDLDDWSRTGATYVVRIHAQDTGNGSHRLVAELFFARATPTSEAKATPSFQTSVEVNGPDQTRMAAHRAVDVLLGAMTGRPGGFASRMVFTADETGFRRAFVVDSDGADLRAVSPPAVTVLSPAFGPGEQVFYASSRDLSPFRLAFGPDAAPFPIEASGSLLGLAFSADRKQLALTVMREGSSFVYLANGGMIREAARAPFANHPAFGPDGRLAFVAGSPVQRVHVDGKPVSPAGLMASSPVFCDTSQGLLVFYSVRVSSGFDVVASFPGGGGLRRFTRQQGENRDPACSPDGRLIAFFSTRKSGDGPGLYVMPVNRPWLARKVSDRVGGALRWGSALFANVPF